MDKHTCKLCFRRFHNGRALGGHMRSHVVAAAAYAPQQRQQSPPPSSASTSSAEMEGKPEQQQLLSYVLRENPKKSYKVVASEFSGDGHCGGGVAGGESSVVQDGESETECPRAGAGAAVSRRRSKRARQRAPPAAPDPEPASSVSDATPEEDVAMSLVMLSRDSWTRPRSEPKSHWARLRSEAEQDYDNVVDEDDHDVAVDDYEDNDETMAVGAACPRSRYQCGACKKVFRSYQALGGHRASHKKGKGTCFPPPVPTPAKTQRAGTDASPAPAAPVIHECPFCFRVFDSGQALGGHKRAHMSSAAASSSHAALAPPIPSPSPAKCDDSFGFIDLNMPAATEDDFELSAVYDAEFGSARQ